MTDEQRAAHLRMAQESKERVDAMMKPVHDLLDERFKLWRLSCRLELRDLERLNGILARLSDEDMKRVAAFAEGLAEWADSGSESPDGTR